MVSPARTDPVRVLLRDSSVYLTGNLLQKAAAFVLIPVYTRYLSAAQYGLLELANTVVNLLMVATALRVPDAINKCFHRDCTDDPARRRLVGTAVLFTLTITGGLALLAWAASDRLAPLVFPGPQSATIYGYTLVWLVLGQLAIVPYELLRAAGRSRTYLALSIVQLAVQSSVIYGLVRFAGRGLRGVLDGNVAGLLAVLLVAVFALSGRVAWRVDRRLLGALVSFGVATIPVYVASWIINVSDRFFVQKMIGLGALGVYALGYKFGALVDIMLVAPFQRAWTPLFFRTAGDPAAGRRLARVSTLLFAGGCFVSLAVSLLVDPFLRRTATAEFHPASSIVPIVCFAYLLAGLASCLGSGLVVSGRVRLVAFYSVAAAVSNLGFNLALIPLLGIHGAAWATVLAFGLQLAGICVSLARHYPVPVEVGRLAGLLAAAAAPLLLSRLMPSFPAAADAAARAGLLALFPALLYTTGLLRPDEIRAFRNLSPWPRRPDAAGPRDDPP